GFSFPDEEPAGAVAGGEPFSVGGIGDGGDPVGVFFDVVKFFAVGGGEDAQHFSGATEGDFLLIGGNVGGKDDVEFIADFGDTLAGGHIPDGDFAKLGALAAA